jgi:hypothetical protein
MGGRIGGVGEVYALPLHPQLCRRKALKYQYIDECVVFEANSFIRFTN